MRSLPALTFLLLALGALSACGGDDGGGKACDAKRTRATQGYILGGTPTSQHGAVGFLANAERQGICTGILVTSEMVLTAAHCIPGANLTYFGLGDTTSNPTQVVRISGVLTHPGFDSTTRANNVALVRLAEPMSTPPMAVDIQNPVSPGERVALVGFGVTDGATRSGSGTKREVEVSVQALQVGTFSYVPGAGGACLGDSGGPAVALRGGVPTVVGVRSHGYTTDCTDAGHYSRLDIYGSFLGGDSGVVTPPDPGTGSVSGAILCDDRCTRAGDGSCDDGGAGAATSFCPLGSDCSDCGPRESAAVTADGGAPPVVGADGGVSPADTGDGGEPSTAGPGDGTSGDIGGDALCNNDCPSARDGECDDSGPGSVCDICDYGSDCADCGPR